MSYVFLQVGQCGNQVGNEFWSLLSAERRKKPAMPMHSLFHANGFARCVLVDSEPKVIRSLVEQQPPTSPKSEQQQLLYDLKNIRYSQPGCGNNWGLGYHFRGDCECPVMKCHGNLLEETLSAFRFEVEKCDYVKAVFVIHSLGGGTGSGFGCRVIESLRDNYPSMYIVSICVAPYRHGDTPLQHYNTLLSISHVQQFADAVMLFQNDHILLSLNRDFENSATNKKLNKNNYTTGDVNRYIASCLVNMFLPWLDNDKTWRQFDFLPIMTNMCCNPRMKFIEVHTSALLSHNDQAKTSWQYIAEDLVKQMPIYDRLLNRAINNIHALAIVRGGIQSNYDAQMIFRVLCSKGLAPVPWIKLSSTKEPLRPSKNRTSTSEFTPPENIDFLGSNSRPALSSTTKPIEVSLTICANRTHILEFLNHVLVKVDVMLDGGAYLHWYARHGVNRDFLDKSCHIVQQIIDDYVDQLL